MPIFTLATQDMYKDLGTMWQACFGETPDNASFLLDNRVPLTNCAVCIVDGTLVSALYMLEFSLDLGGYFTPAYYIYGVGTMPQFRSQGYMGALMQYTEGIAIHRGVRYLALLPCNEGLYNYYEKFGFFQCFSADFITLSRDELLTMCPYPCSSGLSSSTPLRDFGALRQSNFSGAGFAAWGSPHIKYAMNLNTRYGGRTVITPDGYAICRTLSEGCNVEVLELCSCQNDLHSLMFGICTTFDAKTYTIRVPHGRSLFGKSGLTRRFGMLKNLSPDPCHILGQGYLGLTLD